MNLIFRQRLSNLIFLPFFSLLFTTANAQTTCFWNFLFSKWLNLLDIACCSLYFISKYFKGKRFSSFGCALLLIVVLPKRKVVSLVHIINTFVVVVLKVFYFDRCFITLPLQCMIKTERTTILQELAF